MRLGRARKRGAGVNVSPGNDCVTRQSDPPQPAARGRTGKIGKAVTAVTETGKSRPQKTRKAQMLRKKTRQQSEFMVASIVLGALAIAAGLILLIILALSS